MCRIVEFTNFIYFQAAVSALFWLSHFCTLKKNRDRLLWYSKMSQFDTYQIAFLMGNQGLMILYLSKNTLLSKKYINWAKLICNLILYWFLFFFYSFVLFTLIAVKFWISCKKNIVWIKNQKLIAIFLQDWLYFVENQWRTYWNSWRESGSIAKYDDFKVHCLFLRWDFHLAKAAFKCWSRWVSVGICKCKPGYKSHDLSVRPKPLFWFRLDTETENWP